MLGYAVGEDVRMCSASCLPCSPLCPWHMPARPIRCGSRESTMRPTSTKWFLRQRRSKARPNAFPPSSSLGSIFRRLWPLPIWLLLMRGLGVSDLALHQHPPSSVYDATRFATATSDGGRRLQCCARKDDISFLAGEAGVWRLGEFNRSSRHPCGRTLLSFERDAELGPNPGL